MIVRAFGIQQDYVRVALRCVAVLCCVVLCVSVCACAIYSAYFSRNVCLNRICWMQQVMLFRCTFFSKLFSKLAHAQTLLQAQTTTTTTTTSRGIRCDEATIAAGAVNQQPPFLAIYPLVVRQEYE